MPEPPMFDALKTQKYTPRPEHGSRIIVETRAISLKALETSARAYGELLPVAAWAGG